MQKKTKSNDDKLGKMELNIKDILNKIEGKLDCNGFIALIFNPLKSGGEIIEGDSEHIYAFVDGLKINQATVLLHGAGGDFREGITITNCFRKKFSTYRTFVPQVCSSALCLPILKSDKFILLKGGTITQIDPYFEHEGKLIRAIKHLRDKDKTLSEKANNVFKYAEKEIFRLIKEKPSLFKHKEIDFESVDRENIIDAMMNRDEHSDEVKLIAFEFIPFNVEFKDDKELFHLCDELIRKVQDYLILTGRRYCIGSTKETTINEHLGDKKRKGHLLFCP